MIMPCMNSTSACERGGRVALVDGGSVLLGWPGAPGCTTTGLGGSVCCADIVYEKLAAKKATRRSADFRGERSLRRKRSWSPPKSTEGLENPITRRCRSDMY